MAKSARQLDSTLAEKDACKDRAFSIKLELNGLKARRDNLAAGREFVAERLARTEAEIEELAGTMSLCEKKITKYTLEKKKAAEQKKFKEAAKA